MIKNNVCHFFSSQSTEYFKNYEKAVAVKNQVSQKTFLNKIAKKYVTENKKCEIIHDQYDYLKVDSVFCYDNDLLVTQDGINNGIEVLNKRYVSFFDFYDLSLLNQRKNEISDLYKKRNKSENRTEALKKTAAMLLFNNENICRNAVDTDKLSSFLTRLIMREVNKKSQKGEISKRFLSSISKDGLVVLTDTVKNLCDKIYIIEDDFSAVSSLFMTALLHVAQTLDIKAYACLCPVSVYEKIDHILFPDLSLAFVSSNSFHPLKFENAKIINAKRFLDKELLAGKKNRLNFQRKTAFSLLCEASAQIEKINCADNRIKEIYDECAYTERKTAFENELIKAL